LPQFLVVVGDGKEGEDTFVCGHEAILVICRATAPRE
jgi:hypothetical protein